jgi:probable HAF family extracellular repeat protein
LRKLSGGSDRQPLGGVLLVLTLVSAPAAASPLFQVVDLGASGGAEARATALSSNGLAAGWGTNAGGDMLAFSYDGAIVELLPQPGAQAYGINSSGAIAGTVHGANGAEATVWTNGQAQGLGTLGGSSSHAKAINDQGQVVGSASRADGSAAAFLYQGGSITELAGRQSWVGSSALAINDYGQVTGTAQLSGGLFRAAIWGADGGATQLGTLGGRSSYGKAINASGQVAGTSTIAGEWMRAFLYDGTAMRDLGTLGGVHSGANGIDRFGFVVGYSLLANGESAAFVYADGVMYDLNSFIGPGGWRLIEALAINDAGQIVGTGRLNGETHAFLLDPIRSSDGIPVVHNPEPGTMGLLALGAALVFAGRYRRRTGKR